MKLNNIAAPQPESAAATLGNPTAPIPVPAALESLQSSIDILEKRYHALQDLLSPFLSPEDRGTPVGPSPDYEGQCPATTTILRLERRVLDFANALDGLLERVCS